MEEKERLEELEKYKSDLNGNPSMYVGTYGKHNEGNLYGMWIDLTKVSDAEEFYDVCGLLHIDEQSAEYMCQDYEGFPEKFYHEWLTPDNVQELLNYLHSYTPKEREIIEEYWDEIDSKKDAREILLKHVWDGSLRDYAEHYIEELVGEFGYDIPKIVSNNIDWDGVAYDLSYDFDETSNFVFSNLKN